MAKSESGCGSVDLKKLHSIQQIIQQKYWYKFNQTGTFDFQASTNLVAKSLTELGLNINGDLVRQAINQAISSEYLSKVGNRSLIELLSIRDKTELYLWTVGDKQWQKYKIEHSGAGDYVSEENILIGGQEKITLLTELFSEHPNTRFLVIDDKESTLKEVMKLESEAEKHDVELSNYHFKIHDPQANPQALLCYLDQAQNQNIPLILVVDFDGVIFRTDDALLKTGSKYILQYLK